MLLLTWTHASWPWQFDKAFHFSYVVVNLQLWIKVVSKTSLTHCKFTYSLTVSVHALMSLWMCVGAVQLLFWVSILCLSRCCTVHCFAWLWHPFSVVGCYCIDIQWFLMGSGSSTTCRGMSVSTYRQRILHLCNILYGLQYGLQHICWHVWAVLWLQGTLARASVRRRRGCHLFSSKVRPLTIFCLYL